MNHKFSSDLIETEWETFPSAISAYVWFFKQSTVDTCDWTVRYILLIFIISSTCLINKNYD